MLKPEVKTALLAALKSGKYPKGSGVLCREDGTAPGGYTYCCLGVLCDLGSQSASRWHQKGRNFSYGDDSVKYPPSAVFTAAGLTYAETLDLAELNDRFDSFSPVIAYIEEKL